VTHGENYPKTTKPHPFWLQANNPTVQTKTRWARRPGQRNAAPGGEGQRGTPPSLLIFVIVCVCARAARFLLGRFPPAGKWVHTLPRTGRGLHRVPSTHWSDFELKHLPGSDARPLEGSRASSVISTQAPSLGVSKARNAALARLPRALTSTKKKRKVECSARTATFEGGKKPVH
jgi:hypothetical protein